MFGLCDPSTQAALGYMQIVSDRTAQTLLPLIQQHARPGTEVHIDQWRTYSNVASLPNVGSHATVNHSLHFENRKDAEQNHRIRTHSLPCTCQFNSLNI